MTRSLNVISPGEGHSELQQKSGGQNRIQEFGSSGHHRTIVHSTVHALA